MGQHPHILLAEDDRIISFTLSEKLTLAGYRVTTAANGEIAWKLLQYVAPDLLLLDIRMPIMDGLSLAKRVREISDVPIIFLTAFSDDELVSEAAVVGGYGYLVKPVEVHQIIPSLELALSKAAEIRTCRLNEANYKTAMESSREISVAIGMLLERHALSEEEAFHVMRAYSRRKRIKIQHVASAVICGALDFPVAK